MCTSPRFSILSALGVGWFFGLEFWKLSFWWLKCGFGFGVYLLGFCFSVSGFVFIVYVLYIINVIKLRPSAGWVLYYISLFMILCMVCGSSAGCLCSLLFPYNSVTFLLCLKILQSCNVFIIPCIYYPIPCIYWQGTGGRA